MIASELLQGRVDAGGPGWHRYRLARWVICLTGGLITGAALWAGWQDRELAGSAVAVGLCGVLLLGVGSDRFLPARSASPYQAAAAGAGATAIPMRPVPLRVVVPLIIIGVIMLAAGIVLGVNLLRTGETTRGMAALIVPTVLGAGFAVAGGANLLRPARNPAPVLLTARGVGWPYAGKQQHLSWVDVALVEAWWIRLGPRPQIRANLILLRGHDGTVLAGFPTAKLATDPQVALDAIRRHLAEADATSK